MQLQSHKVTMENLGTIIVFVAQLVEQSLPITDILGLANVIFN